MATRFTPRLLQQATRGYATKSGVRPPIALHGLSGKYASSAYVVAAGKDSKTLDAVESDLKKMKSLITGQSKEARDVKQFLENPTIGSADKTATIKKLLSGKEDAVTRNLFEVLGEHGRLYETEHVIDGFLQLMSAHRGEVEVTVTSATPLDKSALQRLETAIKGSEAAKKGKSVKITSVVNPTIQGGLVVDFGDKTIDLSVSSRVTRMNELLRQSV